MSCQSKTIIARYVWLDSQCKLREKTRTFGLEIPFGPILSPKNKSGYPELLPTLNTLVRDEFNLLNPKCYPKWNFDGSSTKQAVTEDSQIDLEPVAIFHDPLRSKQCKFTNSSNIIEPYLVFCQCTKNGVPVSGNYFQFAKNVFEHKKVKESRPWFGIEQEYVIYNAKTGKLLGWENGEPEAQGKYYCGVGVDCTFGARTIVEEHYFTCIQAGIKISGINQEVMPSQWEFQIGPCEGIDAGHHLWIARYLLHMICEKYGVCASFDPKPVEGWNGSGLHTNISTKQTRESGGFVSMQPMIERLGKKHQEHMNEKDQDFPIYGHNEKRLIGTCETSSRDKFSFGVGDRSASVRIPNQVKESGYGYFEDRRPASDADPYLLTATIAKTICLEE